MKVKQVAGSVEKNLMWARSLSCFQCLPSEEDGIHYGIGQILSKQQELCIPKQNSKQKKPTADYAEVQAGPSTSVSNSVSLCTNLALAPVDETRSKISIENHLKSQVNFNDYVLVRLSTKRSSFKYYIALVLNTKNANQELTVKFLKKCSSGNFIFPTVDDICQIHENEVVSVLQQPLLTKREQYSFILHKFKDITIY